MEHPDFFPGVVSIFLQRFLVAAETNLTAVVICAFYTLQNGK